MARRLAGLAEAVAKDFEPTLGRPRSRVHVILVSQDDASNGWATPFPFNVIEIVAAVPPGPSLIGNTSDWLRLVFVHEYTHILHLDRSRGLFGGLRRVFGRHPALLPNIFVPPWQIEGLATYQESATTREGRVTAVDFRTILDRAAAVNQFASLDRASSARVDWPSGNTPYLFGAYFHEYLARTYGEPSLTRLADETSGRLPYFGAGAFKTVFNKSLGELWRDFERDAEARASSVAETATRLTHHGFIVSAPAFAPDGRLFYGVSNPEGFPALMQRDADGSTREVTTRVGGGRISATGSEIVFDQAEYVRSVGVQGDLYVVARDSGESRRLTREARAGDPDVSPDGSTIVCTVQHVDRRSLATMPFRVGATPVPLLAEPDAHYASPRWSPDGRLIAAERRRTGERSAIVIIDPGTRAIVQTIAAPGSSRNVTPSWTPDGKSVLFAAEGVNGPFHVYLADVGSPRVRRLANTGAGARFPVLSPDGRTLVFVGYTIDGYDLFSLDATLAEWIEVRDAAPTIDSPALAPLDAEGAAPAEYTPWRHLVPRFWTPIVEVDDEEAAIGGSTWGSDALGRHAYAVLATWSTRARPDWSAAYAYDRWRPTLFVDASDDTDPWRLGTVRTRELNAGLVVPFRTFRRTQSLLAAFHASTDRFACGDCEQPFDAAVERRALRGGWSLTTARSYGFSISPEDGVTASLSGEWSPDALGATGTASAIVADFRAFLPAVPRHGVIAMRSAAAIAWGDDDAVREFGAGGSGPRFSGASFDRDAIGLVRGFDTADLTGQRAVVVNLDYRIPLAWIERGVGTWPFFVRSLHGAVFADAGAAWNNRLTRRDRRGSFGLEIASDVVIGYAVPLTVASGIAWRFDPTRSSRGAALFARVGRAF